MIYEVLDVLTFGVVLVIWLVYCSRIPFPRSCIIFGHLWRFSLVIFCLHGMVVGAFLGASSTRPRNCCDQYCCDP